MFSANKYRDITQQKEQESMEWEVEIKNAKNTDYYSVRPRTLEKEDDC